MRMRTKRPPTTQPQRAQTRIGLPRRARLRTKRLPTTQLQCAQTRTKLPRIGRPRHARMRARRLPTTQLQRAQRGTKLPRITRQPTRTRIRLPSREQHSSLLPVRRQLPMRSLRLVPRQHPGPRLIRKALLVRRKKRPEESEASVTVDWHAIRRSICGVRSSKKCYWRGSSPGARAIFLSGRLQSK